MSAIQNMSISRSTISYELAAKELARLRAQQTGEKYNADMQERAAELIGTAYPGGLPHDTASLDYFSETVCRPLLEWW